MNVVNYLKEHGIGKLVTEFSIKIKEYDEGLIVLNYNQIDSPKAHPIVMECRGLILDKEYNVVSRSFDRFFNIGEQPDTQAHIDMSKAVCYDKIDGSLIRIYNYEGVWYVATRGTAFAESGVNGFAATFKDLVFKSLEMASEEEFQHVCNTNLHSQVTYIAEVTSMENRVVRAYSGYKLHYLATRNNCTFEFEDWASECLSLGMLLPQQYSFGSTDECVETAKTLKNLDEGYVLYQDGVPVCKIKSPAYCAVHLLRGEGLNPKRIAELVLTGEQEEYLTYFPEDREYITPYVKALHDLLVGIVNVWEANKALETQKEYALAVKDCRGSATLFYLRKNNCSVTEAWNAQTDTYKLKVLLEAMQ